ncbi:unnamed protein product [Didymodactylos carnosus]|uniref:C2H2-type domain-containing protein n=1 Tax=Didymodactylos carnosus TaxID=1234261 RepID=A0A815AME3_9BILA|nr:unnamed protein product [Didymodactylos carnosus]CAF4032868.1 unnamed protein product [Didymodactylos carnosus]
MSRRKQLHPRPIKGTIFLLTHVHHNLTYFFIKKGTGIDEKENTMENEERISINDDDQTRRIDTEVILENKQTIVETELDEIDHTTDKITTNENSLFKTYTLPEELKYDEVDKNLFVKVKDLVKAGTVINAVFTSTCLLDNISNETELISPCEESSVDVIVKQESLVDVIVKQESIECESKKTRVITDALQEQHELVIDKVSGKKLYPLVYSCEDCGIRYSNRGTLDAHRLHYCTRRTTLNNDDINQSNEKKYAPDCELTDKVNRAILKRKSPEETTTYAHKRNRTSEPNVITNTKSTDSNNDMTLNNHKTYCQECDILFLKPENLTQHKLHYCQINTIRKSHPHQIKSAHQQSPPSTSTTYDSKSTINDVLSSLPLRPPIPPNIPFDRPIQVGNLIYIPVPVGSKLLHQTKSSSSSPPSIPHDSIDDKPLDLSNSNQMKTSSISNTLTDMEKLNEKQLKRLQSPTRSLSLTSSVSPSNPLDLSCKTRKTLVRILNSQSPNNQLPSSATVLQKFECEFCTIRFSSLKNLRAHQENYCAELKKTTMSTDSTPHLFSSEQSSSKQRNLLSTTTTSFTCLNCSKIFLNTYELSSHECSKGIDQTMSKLKENEETSTNGHRLSPFMCRLCRYRGNTIRGMRMHFKYHLANGEQCSDEDIITYSSGSNSNHQNSNFIRETTKLKTIDLLKCLICSAMFETNEILMVHLRTHMNETEIECMECLSRFSSRWNLLRHMRIQHTNINTESQENSSDDDNSDESYSSINVGMEIDDNNNEFNNTAQQILNTTEHSNDIRKSFVRAECIVQKNTTESFQLNKKNIDNKRKSSQISSIELSEKMPDSLLSSTGELPVSELTKHTLESILVRKMKHDPTYHSTRKYVCQYCNKEFFSHETLKQHQFDHCQARQNSSKSEQSKKQTNNEHISTVRALSPREKNSIKQSSLPNSSHTSLKIQNSNTFCKICNIPFRLKTSYEAHKMYYCKGNV